MMPKPRITALMNEIAGLLEFLWKPRERSPESSPSRSELDAASDDVILDVRGGPVHLDDSIRRSGQASSEVIALDESHAHDEQLRGSLLRVQAIAGSVELSVGGSPDSVSR